MNRNVDYPLHVAAKHGDVPEVERLLSEGEDPNNRLYQVQMKSMGILDKGLLGTPLHVAVSHCPAESIAAMESHFAVIRLLLSKGADVNADRSLEGTPLHIATEDGNVHLAELLLSNGADINSTIELESRTPLHRAVALGKIQMVEFLTSQGADPNAVADSKLHENCARIFEEVGMTPLHIAAREGYLEIAQILLAAGASKEIRKEVTACHFDACFEERTAFGIALVSQAKAAHSKKILGKEIPEGRQVDWDKVLEILDPAGSITPSGSGMEQR